MLLIFLSWIYIVFTTINLGFITDKSLSLKNTNFIIQSVLGLFTATVLASIWAIFGRINIEFHVFIFIINCTIIYKHKTEIKNCWYDLFNNLKQLNFPLKIILATLFVLIIAQCASKPYIIDNESYYIQTIKWINEYGFVKGLANLHIFFGQTSGWHIAQSAFNFSFIYKNFNDLSGYCLLLGNVFAILKLNEFFKNNNKNYLIAALIPLANVFFFQFISAPSPDLPVYILTLSTFYYFIRNFDTATIQNFNLIVILVLFIFYCKPTSLALLLLPLIILILNFRKLIYKLVPIAIVSSCFLVLFLTKNSIITGYPLFPTQTFGLTNLDFAVPQNVISFYFNETKLFGFFVSSQEYQSSSAFQIALKWLFAPKIDGFINLFSILILVISPVFIYKYLHRKSIWILYIVIVLQMMLLFLSSPQFRFFIHLTLFLSFIIFSTLFNSKRYILLLNYLSIILLATIVFLPLNFKTFTQNKFLNQNSNFNIQNSIFPHSNSKFTSTFVKIQKGNLNYNSPANKDFFWGNGDGNLPCVNQDQLNYFEKYLQVLPQMRTNDLKDGFYAKKLSSND